MRIVLNSLQIGRCSLIFTALLMHTTTLTISTKIFLRLILASLFRPELFIKSFLQSLLTLPSSVPQHFSTPYFCVQQSVQVFSLPQPLANSGWIKGPASKGVLWGLTLYILPQSVDRDIRAHNDWSFTAQFQKNGFLLIVVSDGDIWNQNEKPSSHLFPYPQPDVITSILIPLQENSDFPISQLHYLIFILNLAFLNTIHAPFHQYVLKYSPLTIEY